MIQYSIAQARDRLSQIVHSAEAGETVELTRRGHPVAILLSIEEYNRLQRPARNFGQAVLEFRRKYDVSNWEDDVDLDAIFDVRDKSPGREVDLWS